MKIELNQRNITAIVGLVVSPILVLYAAYAAYVVFSSYHADYLFFNSTITGLAMVPGSLVGSYLALNAGLVIFAHSIETLQKSAYLVGKRNGLITY
jgi:hypothetical protein